MNFKAKDKLEGFLRLKNLYEVNKLREPSSFDFEAFRKYDCKTTNCLAGILPDIYPGIWVWGDTNFIFPLPELPADIVLDENGEVKHEDSFTIEPMWFADFFAISTQTVNCLFFPCGRVDDSYYGCAETTKCTCGCNGHTLSGYCSLEEAMTNFRNELNCIARELDQDEVL